MAIIQAIVSLARSLRPLVTATGVRERNRRRRSRPVDAAATRMIKAEGRPSPRAAGVPAVRTVQPGHPQ